MRFFFLLCIVLSFSCTKEQDSILPSREGLPDQESWGVLIILTDQGITRAQVKSDHLEKYHEKEFIILNDNVRVDYYNNKEEHTLILYSDKAEINQNSNDMKAVGNVIAQSDSGITLYTKTLTWVSKEEKLITKDSIMITTLEFDTLYGIGFESDSDLKNWKILRPSGVSGRELQ